MEALQNVANEVVEIDQAMAESGKTPVDFVITPQHQMWIDYEALGGIITDSTNEVPGSDGRAAAIRKMTMTEFASLVGVDRETLRRWRTQIPNFWDRVAQRRTELNGQSRLAALHEKWYVQAMTFKNWAVTEAFLINFDPNYKTPKVKVEHDIGDNYAALLAAAARDNIIDGEVTNATAIDAGTSPADQSAHPNSS